MANTRHRDFPISPLVHKHYYNLHKLTVLLKHIPLAPNCSQVILTVPICFKKYLKANCMFRTLRLFSNQLASDIRYSCIDLYDSLTRLKCTRILFLWESNVLSKCSFQAQYDMKTTSWILSRLRGSTQERFTFVMWGHSFCFLLHDWATN